MSKRMRLILKQIPQVQWSKEAIQALLATNDKAVCRALLQIYQRQTPGEKSSFSTQVSNDSGFTASDAPTLTKLARRVERGISLSPAEINLARARLMKYSRQLLEVIVDRELSQLKHSA